MSNTEKEQIKFKARVFVFALTTVWLILFLSGRQYDLLIDWRVIIFWGILQFIFESINIKLQKGASSVGFANLIAVILLYGPLTAGIVALFGGLTWQILFRIDNSPPIKWLFNGVQTSISSLLAGFAYYFMGGKILLDAKIGFTFSTFHTQVLPLLSAIGVFYIVNTMLVSLVISINEGIKIRDLWSVSFSWGDLNYIALGFLGIIFAELYFFEPFALILLIVPLAIARQTFSNYMKLEEAYSSTIGALIKAIEAKDPYTKGHSERVAMLSEKIARQLNLPEDQVESVKRIAALHDIGKIGVPKRILLKSSKLTDKEFASIKEHPHIGARILKDVPFLKDLIPAVYYHHEKVDGSGYATGLSGTNIPLFARIIAIADSYDAMTSNRAYRKKMPKKVVIEQILENSGKQFDTIVVKALLEVLEIELKPEQQENLLQTRVLQVNPT